LTLSKCLTIIENSNKKIAFVPIAAYLARKGEIPVWVIFCKWEFLFALSDTTNTEEKYITYVHTRQWAIETKEFKIIEFQTCE